MKIILQLKGSLAGRDCHAAPYMLAFVFSLRWGIGEEGRILMDALSLNLLAAETTVFVAPPRSHMKN